MSYVLRARSPHALAGFLPAYSSRLPPPMLDTVISRVQKQLASAPSLR